MSAGAFTFYNSAKKDILDGTTDLDNDTIIGILVTDGYTPSATHSTYADVSSSECTDGDYTPQELTTKAFSEASGTVTYDGDDLVYGTSVTITAKYMMLVRRAGASLASTDLLVGYVDLDTGGGAVGSIASDFAVKFHADGVFTAT